MIIQVVKGIISHNSLYEEILRLTSAIGRETPTQANR